MQTLGLIAADSRLPCTVYYRSFLEAIHRHPDFRAGQQPTLVVPAEDIAQELNWPRYGRPESAYCRGSMPPRGADPFREYWAALIGHAMRHPEVHVLVLNMDPFRRLASALAPFTNVILADGSLTIDERAANPRTISMPSLPFLSSPSESSRPRTHLASFQGVASHPVRLALASLHNARDIIVRLVPRAHHVGMIDAEQGVTDATYQDLLDCSVFALVPRGDSHFSYRLLEAMIRGAVPVIISDGWVLPFDRSVDWPSCSLRVAESQVSMIPDMLRNLSPAAVAGLQARVRALTLRFFGSLDAIVAALVAEAALSI